MAGKRVRREGGGQSGREAGKAGEADRERESARGRHVCAGAVGLGICAREREAGKRESNCAARESGARKREHAAHTPAWPGGVALPPADAGRVSLRLGEKTSQ